MDMFYKKLSLYLSENQNINKDDEELYEYAAKVVVHGIINIAVIILIGAFFEMLKECICFFITFFVLRKFTGGIHAKKYINCLLSSGILISISLFIIKICIKYDFNSIFFIGIIILSSFVLIILSPLENQNKPLSNYEIKVYKLILIIFLVINLIWIFYLIYKNSSLLYAFGLGQILTTILLLCGYYVKNYKHKEKM